jgi:8-oxo-dGTP pyrophosphatase MutT (NUDIX family)
MNKQPKNISYGIIIYKLIDYIPYYCLICRRDSFTYSEFIRGKYQLEDVETIYRMLTFMTEQEKDVIQNNDFDTLWDKLWVLDKKRMASYSFKKEYNKSKYKFNTLKKGYYTTIHLDIGLREKKFIKLEDIVNELGIKNIPKYTEPEWGFPKGKRNKNESIIDCAKREVLEETNIQIDQLVFTDDEIYEESFIGDNLIEYVHIYYLAECPGNVNLEYDSNNIHQLTEISRIEWLTYQECLDKIRIYNIEKRELLKNINDKIVKTII